MEKYAVKSRNEIITADTVLSPADYGGWQVVNIGDTAVTVNSVLLDPAGALAGVDYTQLPPNVIWEEAISIRFSRPLGSNPRVAVTRLKYELIDEEKRNKREFKPIKIQR